MITKSSKHVITSPPPPCPQPAPLRRPSPAPWPGCPPRPRGECPGRRRGPDQPCHVVIDIKIKIFNTVHLLAAAPGDGGGAAQVPVVVEPPGEVHQLPRRHAHLLPAPGRVAPPRHGPHPRPRAGAGVHQHPAPTLGHHQHQEYACACDSRVLQL